MPGTSQRRWGYIRGRIVPLDPPVTMANLPSWGRYATSRGTLVDENVRLLEEGRWAMLRERRRREREKRRIHVDITDGRRKRTYCVLFLFWHQVAVVVACLLNLVVVPKTRGTLLEDAQWQVPCRVHDSSWRWAGAICKSKLAVAATYGAFDKLVVSIQHHLSILLSTPVLISRAVDVSPSLLWPLMDFLKSAVASAIAKSSSFPVTIGDRIDISDSIWTLHNGVKKVCMVPLLSAPAFADTMSSSRTTIPPVVSSPSTLTRTRPGYR